MKQIFKLHERPSSQIKELRLLYEEDNGTTGVYQVYTKWPNCPELDDYCRVIFDGKSNNINALDFDSGPMIYSGYRLDENNKVVKITRDSTNGEFLVKVKENKD